MRSIKLFLLLLGILFGASASRAVLPAGVSLSGGKHCNSFLAAVSVSGGTIKCSMSNVNSGDTIIFGFNLATATTYTVTATESPTCPGALAATRNVGGFIHNNAICFLVLSSSHSSFQITVTINSGGGAHQAQIEGWEFAGLGSVDSSSETAVNAVTTSFTTAAGSEFAFSFVSDQNTPLSPSGSNNQFGQIAGTNTSGSDYRSMSMTQTTGSAGSYTAAFSPSCGANSVCFVSVVAFAVSGGSPQGSIYVNQQAQYMFADGGGVTGLNLNNTLAGSKVIVAYIELDNATAATCDTLATGETCTCPAGAVATHTYSTGYVIGICYADLTSAHSGLQAIQIRGHGGGFQEFMLAGAFEIVGLQTGADTPSAAAAAALTVNYTTAAANEWTFGVGADGAGSYPPNLMTPGNSFSPSCNGVDDFSGFAYNELMTADKTTSSSGSNTFSYTMTSSTIPMVSTLSFGGSTAKYSMHSRIM